MFFSVIMPIYNSEEFLADAINSVIDQSVGFRENIQLILVNDGSKDSSGEICRKYKESYPDNVIYIEQKNSGVSAARNKGYESATGTYVNFMDSDDKWDKDAFKNAMNYLREHPETEIATARILLFGRGKTRIHPLDYKYKTTKVIDIEKDYKYPEYLVNKTFIRRDVIGDHRFNTGVSYGEDALYINTLIIKCGRYTVLKDAVYYYRKRSEKETSLSDASTSKMENYYEYPELAYGGLIDYSMKEKGEIVPYLQYSLTSTLRWRIYGKSYIENLPKEMTKERFDEYLEYLRTRYLSVIDDKYILEQKGMDAGIKTYILRAKYGNDAFDKNTELKEKLSKRITLKAKFVDADDKYLHILGEAIEKYIGDEYRIYAKDNNGKIYSMSYSKCPTLDKKGVYEEVSKMMSGYTHCIRLPLKTQIKYTFYLKNDKDESIRKLKISFNDFARLTNYKDSFFSTGKHIIKQKSKNTLCIYDYKLKTWLASTYRYHKTLSEIENRPDIVKLRRKVILEKAKSRKPIWIISDRTDLAGDNGEAMFRWLLETGKKNNIDFYYVISESSPDYERLSKTGRVLKYGSEQHFIKQLAASVILDSSGSYLAYNPMNIDFKYVRDLVEYKRVFLQHGTTIHDLSGWINKYSSNFSLFITSATPEYDSIINGKYGLSEAEVKLTGFARHDLLKDEKEKVISFAPTWRQSIATQSANTMERGYSTAFRDTDYFKFYNSLINDERILEAMRKHGYSGKLYLHPNHRAQACDFEANELIGICDKSFSYTEMFNKSALLITDYSSVAMDFAYLRKPVVYTQFNKEEIYKVQVYSEGYFDFERDGFGPVCYDYETAVKEIVKMIENNCVEPKKYSDRVDRFFPYKDSNNRERIFNEIVANL